MLNASIVVYSQHSKINHFKLEILAKLVDNLSSHPLLSSLLIVDNSPFPYFSRLASYPNIFYHHSPENVGYGAGHNLSRQFLSPQKYHLIVNPDIDLISPNVINILIDYLEQQAQVCMIQPQITTIGSGEIQHLCKLNPTLFAQVSRLLISLFPRIRFLKYYNNRYIMLDKAYNEEIISSSYLSGCFMLCRTKNLDQVGWFDERFFMYLEDADLTRSLSNIGECLHYPKVKIGHLWARQSYSSPFLFLVAIHSFIKYSMKWGLKLI
ncbi:hypothetical protein [Synechococcus sp. RS9916]|uniref:hypothetical protein n=1 Tax=Synechococcus sp. RS9916 TaxID=221359 RepID=UPI0000E5377B|nr:hypothetical protein [Synechococcus sp. RS9916]EAU75554.1 putative lipopolysaccharide biosynthesis glycosyltransferase [Synechococcus sp. RS9916]